MVLAWAGNTLALAPSFKPGREPARPGLNTGAGLGPVHPVRCPMRMPSSQSIVWMTVLAAVLSAYWLASQ